MRRSLTAALLSAVLVAAPGVLADQNQTPPAPARGQQPAPQGAAQKPAPGNQSAPAPEAPASVPLYVSPSVVQHVQRLLMGMGFPVPALNGGWGDTTSAAVALFQAKQGLDPGGDLDEQTLVALGLPQVLVGEVPPDATPVASLGAAGNGAPLAASPSAARLVQNTLTEAGFPTDNLFGIWMAGSEAAARNFQKARGLDITGALDLRLFHALGLTASLTDPKPGAKSKYDAVAQILAEKAIPFTGVPLSISPTGVRQVQTALQQKGHKEVAIDGKWNEASSAALKKFQESQKLEATGTINLPTLRALGFARPLADLDQAAATNAARPPSQGW